jgi:hypothetical protein
MVGEPVETDRAWTGTWARPAAEPVAESETTDSQRGHPANRVTATVLGAPGTTVYVGQVPGDRHQAVLRREGREAVFATIVDPYRATDVVASVRPVETSGPVPAFALKVTRKDGGTDVIVVRYDQQRNGESEAPTQVEGGRTDALVSVVRLGETVRPIDMVMVGGHELSYADFSLKRDEPGIKCLEDSD